MKLVLSMLLLAVASAHPSWYDPARHLQAGLPKLRKLVDERIANAGAYLPEKYASLVRRLNSDSGGGLAESCAPLTQVDPNSGMNKAFCDMTDEELAAVATLSGNDGAASCDFMPETKALLCHMCTADCLNSPNAALSGNDDGSSAPPVFADVCADGCVRGMMSLLKKYAKKESQCIKNGKSTDLSSVNDDSSSGDSSSGDSSSGDGSSGGFSMDQFGAFEYGCVTDDAGNNCFDVINTAFSGFSSDSSSSGSSSGSSSSRALSEPAHCASTEGTTIRNTGCCFGSFVFGMSQVMSEDESEGVVDATDMVGQCSWASEVMTPCSKGGAKDIAIVKSTIAVSMDMSTLTDTEKRAVKKVFKEAIADDLGSSITSKNVLITKMASSGRRRLSGAGTDSVSRRLATTNVEYQVTFDPEATAVASIQSKISAGDVKPATIVAKAQASSDAPTALKSLSATDFVPATTSESTTVIAEDSINGAMGAHPGGSLTALAATGLAVLALSMH